jgi:hypothetical protein
MTLIVRFALVLLAAGCGGSPVAVETIDEAESANSLTPPQAKTVLVLLGDACADAWCEGDYEWAFKKVSCRFSSGACTLTLLVKQDSGRHRRARSFWRSCALHELGSFDALVETAANGYQSLKPGFFDQVDRCIGKIEATLAER